MKDDTIVYYIVEGHMYEGKLIDVERRQGRTFFSIEGYGSCEGPYRICEDQINKWIYTDRKQAELHIKSLHSRLHEK